MVGPWCSVRVCRIREVNVANRVAGSVILAGLVDAVVHCVVPQYRVRSLGGRIRSANPRRLLALQYLSGIAINRVYLGAATAAATTSSATTSSATTPST